MVLKKGDFVSFKDYRYTVGTKILHREEIYSEFNVYEIVNITPGDGLGPKYDIKCLDSNKISEGWAAEHFEKIKVNNKTLKILFGSCNE